MHVTKCQSFNSLQKAIHIICNTSCLSHCAPLAKQCDIVFVNDLYTVFIYKYMLNVFHYNTVYYLHLFYHPGHVHSHNTRNVNHNYFVFPVHTLCRKKFIVHTGIMLWNKLPSNITLLGYDAFIGYVKNTIFSNYV